MCGGVESTQGVAGELDEPASLPQTIPSSKDLSCA